MYMSAHCQRHSELALPLSFYVIVHVRLPTQNTLVSTCIDSLYIVVHGFSANQGLELLHVFTV